MSGFESHNRQRQSQKRDVHERRPGLLLVSELHAAYTYDKVNRLQSASDSGGWSRGFGYDPYGNMWVTSNGGVPLPGNTPTSNVYTGANRIVGRAL